MGKYAFFPEEDNIDEINDENTADNIIFYDINKWNTYFLWFWLTDKSYFVYFTRMDIMHIVVQVRQ